MPRVLKIHHGDDTYTVNERGEITRPSSPTPSGDWMFLGFSEHHWSNRITYPLAEIFADPSRLKNTKRLYGWDVDHGTVRQWCSPRTIAAWVEAEGR